MRDTKRMLGSLIFVVATVGFLPSAARAQVYLYGRADFQAGPNPAGVVVADFNGDGRPDMAVSNIQNNTVSVLLGQSNGSFVTSGSYATGTNPSSLTAADFNGDKKADLAVVNSNAGTISILLGNGDGTFQGRSDYPVGQNPTGVVAADFNGDGKIDLATASTNDSSVAILLGKGDGSFEVQALVPLTSVPGLLAARDVNGDKKIDLITVGSYDSTITVLINKGDGTFAQVGSQGPGSATALAVGDFNHDGKPDALMSAYYGGLFLSLGNGDGSFQNPISIPNSPNQYGSILLVGDFNHDHKLDIAVTGLWVMLGNDDGTFKDPVLYPAVANPVALVDANGDGEPDLVTVTNAGLVSVLLGDGSGGFMDVRSMFLASASYSNSPPAAAADFNGDGKLDLAVGQSNYPDGQVSVVLGKGNGTFGQPIVSVLGTSATSPYVMYAGDFNGDRKDDLVVVDDNGNGFQVLLGQGNGGFGTAVDTPLSYRVNGLVVGDLNGDGKADVVVNASDSNSPSVSVYLSNGDGTFTPGLQYVIYPNSSVSTGDVNGDGNLDLVVAASSYGSGDSLLVFLGRGDGTFNNPLFGPIDTYSSQAAIGDFNGDGKADIAVGTSGVNGIAFLPGNGDGTFGTQMYSDQGLQVTGGLIASDFSGDGKLDLAVSGSYNVPGLLVMRSLGDGTFGAPTEYDALSNGYPSSMAAGDFNSDQVSDLAIATEVYNSGYLTEAVVYLSRPTPDMRPTALTFAGVLVGQTSPPKKVRLSNIGNSKMKISTITVSGDFLETNNCGKVLAIGKSCTVQVSFKPQSKGIRTGELSITDNAPGKTQKVSLKGTGK